MPKQQIRLNESSLKEMIREAMSEYNTWRLSAPKDEYRNFVMHLIETDDAKEIASILLDSMEEEDIKNVVFSSDYFDRFRMNNDNSFADKPQAVNIDEAIRKAINKIIK